MVIGMDECEKNGIKANKELKRTNKSINVTTES